MGKLSISRVSWAGVTFFVVLLMFIYSWVEFSYHKEKKEDSVYDFRVYSVLSSFWTILLVCYIVGGLSGRMGIVHDSYSFMIFNAMVFICSMVLLVTASIGLQRFFVVAGSPPYSEGENKSYFAYLVLTIILSSLMIIGFFVSVGDFVSNIISNVRDTLKDTLELTAKTVGDVLETGTDAVSGAMKVTKNTIKRI
jgi:hypothetical protein